MLQLVIRLIAFFKSERDDEQESRETLQYEGMTHNEWLQRMSRSHIRYLKRGLSYWKRKPTQAIHRLRPQVIVKMP